MPALPMRFLLLMMAGSALSVGLLGVLPAPPLTGTPSPVSPGFSPGSPSMTPPTSFPPQPLTVQASDYGVDVFSYDTQLLASSTVPTIETLGMGMQQFPNENQWSWVTNTFRGGGTAPVSLARWGQLLTATHNTGLFIFDYDENPTFTGGGTPADATQLTQYIVQHHLPITAIVIGSEEYGRWDHSTNLNPSFSAEYYATQVLHIAQAIHAVDPAMQVGVSFDLGDGPNGLLWDQTVLRTDAAAIQFVSIHDYPNATLRSNTGLLTELPQEIAQAMAEVQTEIAANVPPGQATRLKTWVTEYNPYGEPGPQSTASVYGAEMVESAMLWRLDGAQKLFLWSYDGQAHTTAAGWLLATKNEKPFGLFALTGDGQSPELGENALYPSGQALSEYLQAMAGGPTSLAVSQTPQGYAGTVGTGPTTSTFLINTSATPMVLAGATVPATALAVVHGPVAGPIGTPVALSPTTAIYQSAPPAFTAPATISPGEMVTLTGQHLTSGPDPSRVVIQENGVDYGGLPDAYGVTVAQSTPTSLMFQVPNGINAPALPPGTATLQVQTADQTISVPQSVQVIAPPPITLSIASAQVTPAEWVTLTGSEFGTTQGTGYVEISQNGVHYRAPPDAYHLAMAHWAMHSIMVQIPGGQSGPALAPGSATIHVVNAQGIASHRLTVTVASA